MRKIISLILCGLMVFSLSACGQKEPVKTTTTTTTDTASSEQQETNELKEMTFRGVNFSIPTEMYEKIGDENKTYEIKENYMYGIYDENRTIYVMCFNFDDPLNEVESSEKFDEQLKLCGLKTEFKYSDFKNSKNECIESKISFNGLKGDGTEKECAGYLKAIQGESTTAVYFMIVADTVNDGTIDQNISEESYKLVETLKFKK